ncbi:hypothetical protein INT47_002276 [Mucor saturninus]|uniref:Cysteine-rich transmembrane domain-containing protein n=1 Tax=Mucor saturninus TaxID=64648 RepID=A0A8H7UZY5_9FUNG|nr:hypothetical protein INT47_002276 [Mucor saturninus]
MSTSEKRPKDISNRHLSASFTRQVSEPKPVAGYFYKPTPPPETVVVHSVPKKTNDACCWGCAAALCLCFGLEECCSS